jgi:hypothetical protein
MASGRNGRWIAAGAGFGIVAIAFAVLAAGAGHGTYLPAIVLFRFAMLSTQWTVTVSPFAVWSAVLQFPAYGAILKVARRRAFCAGFLGTAHAITAGLALAFANPTVL